MNFFAAQRIFSILIVLALIAGTPVRLVFAGTVEAPMSACADAEQSARGCCDKGLSIDVCAPQCAAFVALPAFDEADPLPWPLAAPDTFLPSQRLWSADIDFPPPKRLSHA